MMFKAFECKSGHDKLHDLARSERARYKCYLGCDSRFIKCINSLEVLMEHKLCVASKVICFDDCKERNTFFTAKFVEKIHKKSYMKSTRTTFVTTQRSLLW